MLWIHIHSYYFVEGHALNDRPRLAKVAAERLSELIAKDNTTQQQSAMMSEEDILLFLNGDEGKLEIHNALVALQQIGVSGIPKFIIEGTRVVDGAACPETFIQIFRDIEKRGEIEHGPIFASILGVDEDTWKRGSHKQLGV